jgi:hypothetical protein
VLGEVTVRFRVVVCVALAPVPVIVIVYGPVAAPEATVIVRVDELPAVTEDGLNEALPDGWPLTDRLTDCAEPLVTAVLTVTFPLEPLAMLVLVGLALIEKSSVVVPVTVSVTVVLWVALGPAPVRVIG